jgi:hypothetical protein
VNDLALLAYLTPPPGTTIRMGLTAVGGDNCTIYGNNWNGSSWSGWSLITSCFNQVSAFNTRDIGPSPPVEGAFVLFLHQSSGALYTLRYNSGAWGGLVQQTVQPWIAVAGANFEGDRDPPYEHDVFSDDCRRQNQTCFPDPNVPGTCFWADTLNLAEILYNEARGETRGAQATVGWTVRDRAYQRLSCDSYPGAEGGGNVTQTCRATVPCSDPNFCDSSKRYCCVMHGGTTTLGAPQSQFNDEHVPFNTLYTGGFAYRAVHILNGWIPDVSTGFIPSGLDENNGSRCNTHNPPVPGDCGDPFCNPCVDPDCELVIINPGQASPRGPQEFRSGQYSAQNPSCKQAPTVNTCQGAANNFVCCNASPNNYFWNRKP